MLYFIEILCLYSCFTDIMYIQGDFSLPAWNDTGDIPRKFCKWFNDNARKKWNDNKNHCMHRSFDRCQGFIDDATAL